MKTTTKHSLYFNTAGPASRHLTEKYVDEWCKVYQHVDVSKLHPKSETGQSCEVTAIDENVLGEVHTIKLNNEE